MTSAIPTAGAGAGLLPADVLDVAAAPARPRGDDAAPRPRDVPERGFATVLATAAKAAHRSTAIDRGSARRGTYLSGELVGTGSSRAAAARGVAAQVKQLVDELRQVLQQGETASSAAGGDAAPQIGNADSLRRLLAKLAALAGGSAVPGASAKPGDPPPGAASLLDAIAAVVEASSGAQGIDVDKLAQALATDPRVLEAAASIASAAQAAGLLVQPPLPLAPGHLAAAASFDAVTTAAADESGVGRAPAEVLDRLARLLGEASGAPAGPTSGKVPAPANDATADTGGPVVPDAAPGADTVPATNNTTVSAAPQERVASSPAAAVVLAQAEVVQVRRGAAAAQPVADTPGRQAVDAPAVAGQAAELPTRPAARGAEVSQLTTVAGQTGARPVVPGDAGAGAAALPAEVVSQTPVAVPADQAAAPPASQGASGAAAGQMVNGQTAGAAASAGTGTPAAANVPAAVAASAAAAPASVGAPLAGSGPAARSAGGLAAAPPAGEGVRPANGVAPRAATRTTAGAAPRAAGQGARGAAAGGTGQADRAGTAGSAGAGAPSAAANSAPAGPAGAQGDAAESLVAADGSTTMNGTGSVPSATTGVSAPGQAVAPAVPVPAGATGGQGTGGTDATRGPDGLAAAARGGVGSLLDQISPVLVRQARLISVGETHQMTLRLSPESLGPVQVHIALGDGGLSVDLTATNANAHRALETALPQLRGSLADAGIRLERLDVGLRDSGNSNQNRNFAGNGGGDRGAGGNGGAPGRQFGGQSGQSQSGPTFSDFLVDQDGQPFDVRLRQGGLSGVGLPGSSSPFNTGRATPGAFSRAGYGAYGALRSFISRGLRSRG